MNLPWGATPDVLPPEGEPFQVRWSSARLPHLERVDDEIHVTSQGRRWRFASAAAPLLEGLVSGQPLAVGDLSNDALDPQTVRAFVRELASNGLIVVV